ncbi:Maturation and nuclear export of 40S ribosomal subunits interacting protein [Coemansia sp. RSA 1813]|nr:Maturation and nuclear export of 40S ribosomal subunits interacting protein [Coemansia sp. RSA 1646]KAJ1773169.1 Maturation and nuclear export of 40S ribosomal subunits interacting protein [Coemansia sp. RSA 1843]KAJ2092046.1 Maturation and nuclear export of 40S ribosomal subunits interacting protein [Coemansia sp. RSA 986]KAJ2216617.1 Maturation and nuclear export of 40S ribosomal subunits interacting protein [Coemansia sp. RSA 487]KAJ2572099.1 Maturation and nuclear export of 40S ribosomal
MAPKRKFTNEKEEAQAKADQVLKWESAVLQSQQNLNNIVDIFNVAKDQECVETSFAAINSLGRIYYALWTKGLLSRCKDTDGLAQEKVGDWLRSNYKMYTDLLRSTLKSKEAPMQVGALRLLVQMLEREGHRIHQSTDVYTFPNASFLAIVDSVLDNAAASEHLLRTLAESYINSYDDMRYYFYRNVVKLASPEYDPFKRNSSRKNANASGSGSGKDSQSRKVIEDTPMFIKNAFTVMGLVRVMPKTDVMKLTDFWVKLPDEIGETEPSILSPSAHRKAFSEAWLALLRLPLTPETYKQILLIMHKRIIPHMTDPKALMDFLSNSYDVGGSTSLLALNGLFTLITDYNLNYPQFYEKLYALLDRNLFHVKYRARFFRLLEVFLASSHLPAYLIAAFAKRISRLALSAPPSGAVIAIPMVYNLLKAHPSCMVLIHRMPGFDSETGEQKVTEEIDPYVSTELDPAKCMALQSSLWELATLQHHYYANIATLANIFNEPFHKPKFVLEDFLDHTYTTFFESDTARKPKKAPALATQPPMSLFRAGDAISDFMVY